MLRKGHEILEEELFSKFEVLPSAQCYLTGPRTLSLQMMGWEGRGATGLFSDARPYSLHTYDLPLGGSVNHHWPKRQGTHPAKLRGCISNASKVRTQGQTPASRNYQLCTHPLPTKPRSGVPRENKNTFV